MRVLSTHRIDPVDLLRAKNPMEEVAQRYVRWCYGVQQQMRLEGRAIVWPTLKTVIERTPEGGLEFRIRAEVTR